MHVFLTAAALLDSRYKLKTRGALHKVAVTKLVADGLQILQ